MHPIQEVLAKAQAKYQALLGEEAVSINDKQYECMKCKDVGGLFEMKVDEDENSITYGKSFQIWVDCECEKNRVVSKLMKASEITEEFKAMTFDNFFTNGAPKVVQDMHLLATKYYAEFEQIQKTKQNSIAYLGQPGSGKTHLLIALANLMMTEKHKSVLYFPFVEGFDDLRSDFEKLEAKMIRMKQVDILFIDDLFKPVTKQMKDGERIKVPQGSEWEIKQLYSVVNYRYMNHKPVFISSELTFDEMIVQMDEGLGTRFYQMCKQFFIHIDKDLGLNYRLK
ncbi:ATP-binding protein [Lysinibacillus sp. NPDC093712]|uniref:ATP-binding protein n=1 Tax=Lysinibacillus sp. NPDC093712 TaxID=3390579 RepID=UPI003CFFDD76